MIWSSSEQDFNQTPKQEMPFIMPPKKITILKEDQIKQKTLFHVYMLENIGAPKEYVELFNLMKMADENCEIHMYINSPGGYVDTTTQLLNSMAACKAKLFTYAEGEVASAATFIFLAGDVQIVKPNSYFMCHSYSSGAIGKRQEIVSKINFDKKRLDRLADIMYRGLLTDKELLALKNSKDFYFDDLQLITRLKRRMKVVEADAVRAAKHVEKLTKATTKLEMKSDKKTKSKTHSLFSHVSSDEEVDVDDDDDFDEDED